MKAGRLTVLAAAVAAMVAPAHAAAPQKVGDDRDLTQCEAIQIESRAVTKRLEARSSELAATATREAGAAIAEHQRYTAMSAATTAVALAGGGPISMALNEVNRTIHGIEKKRAALVMAREKAASTMTFEQSASRLVQLSYDAMDAGCPEAAVVD